ncbi:hypothetical protein F5Y10DRAFT_288952 [Nemania abortiva]|nr:hypothetical protein F5Y10DRAFT_288952 [Nemania abortiva]
MADSLGTISDNVELLSNLPAMNPGAELLQAIHRLERAVDGLETGLGAHLSALDANNIARLINRDVTDHNAPLEPLFAVLTNEPIADFPRTGVILKGLRDVQVISILRQLGQSVNGSLAEKRKRLRIAIGATKILDEILDE